LVQISVYENNITSPRFGLPLTYNITFNDVGAQGSAGVGLPIAAMDVHWTRVIHVAEAVGSSEFLAYPRLQQNYHRQLDIAKLLAGSAEMYWKGAFPGISIETHPQLGGEVKLDAESIKTAMFDYQNDLQRFLMLTGAAAKTLAPQVVDPTPQVEIQIAAICIEKGYPKRVFMGSERGELASSQDAVAWAKRVRFRQVMYLTPRLIVPLINRLILAGVLPAPKSFTVKWPLVDGLTETDKATVAAQLTTAMSTYVSGGVEQLLEPVDYFVKILGLDSETAKQLAENASENAASMSLDQVAMDAENYDPTMDEDPNQIIEGDTKEETGGNAA
jgi:hypothetical protein